MQYIKKILIVGKIPKVLKEFGICSSNDEVPASLKVLDQVPCKCAWAMLMNE